MAESLAESSVELLPDLQELEELFQLDLTDDDFDFNIDVGETSVRFNENNFISTNVNIASLKVVLDRLSVR